MEAVAAVASYAAAAFTSATAAVASGLTAMGVSAATATAVATQVVTTAVTVGITTGISFLLRPSTPSSGLTLDFKPDTKAPVTGLMGYCATGGNKVFQSTWGYNNVVLSLGAALSLGPIDAITQFRADDKVVSFTGAQNEAAGFYAADMWQKTTLGLPTDSGILPPTGLKYGSPGLTGWGTQNGAKGVAFAFWTMVLAKNPEDRNIFVNGVPDPRWIGRWMKVYDWRKDSTYPGGSGSHRENDWRTWEWTENPILHARAFLRGHYKMKDDGFVDYAYRIAGIGIMPHAMDMDAFNEAANVADANGWKISGSWSSSDSKWDTFVSMLKAASAVPIQNGARVSLMINTPRVSTATITRDDVVGEIQINPLVRRRERKNTIVPRYRSEAHSWEFVPAGAVTSTVYRDEDRNELRSLEVQYTYVRLPKQAAELAAYDLANMRESIKVTATLKADAMALSVGDCVTFNVPEVGLASQKMIIVRKQTDYQSAMVTVECRSETDGKHAWALGQAANPPPTPSLSGNDPLYMPPPLAIDWTVTPQPPSGGSSQPVIIVTGPIDRGDIASVVVEYALAAAGPWTSTGPADPATGKYSIAGLQPNQQYWVSIRYVANNGTISDRYITGPHTAPDLVAQINPNSPILSGLEEQLDELFDTTAIIEGDLNAAEAVINATTAEVVAARQGSPNLAANITNVKTTISNESTTRATEISLLTARTNPNPNLMPQGNFERGNGSLWDTGSVLAYGVNADLGGSMLYAAPVTARFYPRTPPANVWSGFASGFSAQAAYQITSTEFAQACIIFYSDDAGNTPLPAPDTQTPWRNLITDGTVQVFREQNFVKPAAARSARIVFSIGPSSRVILRGRAKIEAGAVATIYSPEASEKDLSATVQQNVIAITDVEAQQAFASWELVAAATGGKPARLKVASSTLGSFVALDAPYIFWGDNTVFDDATDTLQTTVGARIRVMALGAPFGSGGNLLEWWGPTGIALSAMTPANGYNGRMTIAPYVFDNSTAGRMAINIAGNTSVSRTGNGFIETGTVTFTAQNAVGPVSFNVARVDAPAAIDAFPTSSTTNTAPFRHQMNFSANLTTLILGGNFLVTARDANGNTATTTVYIEFTRI